MRLGKFVVPVLMLALYLSPPLVRAAEFRGLYVDAFHPGIKSA